MSEEYDIQKEVVEDELAQFKRDYDKVAANPAFYYASSAGDAFQVMRKVLVKAGRDLSLLERRYLVRVTLLSESSGKWSTVT